MLLVVVLLVMVTVLEEALFHKESPLWIGLRRILLKSLQQILVGAIDVQMERSEANRQSCYWW